MRHEGASEGSTQAGLVGGAEGPPATQRQFQMSQFGFSGGTGPMGILFSYAYVCVLRSDIPIAIGTISTFNDSSTSTSKPIIQFVLRCLPFPSPIREFLARARRRGVLGRLRLSSSRERIGQQPTSASKGDEGARVKESAEERTFWQEFQDVCRKQKGEDTSLWLLLAQKNRFWAFGPQGRNNQTRAQTSQNGDKEEARETGAEDTGEEQGNADADAYGAGCILIDARSNSDTTSTKWDSTSTSTPLEDTIYYDFTPHIEAGFQLAARQGPLCAEPVEGLVFFVERIEVDWRRVRVEIGEYWFFALSAVFTDVAILITVFLNHRTKSPRTNDRLTHLFLP